MDRPDPINFSKGVPADLSKLGNSFILGASGLQMTLDSSAGQLQYPISARIRELIQQKQHPGNYPSPETPTMN